jgi:hypothetical protein
MTLDPQCEAWVQRLVEQAPPLSHRQQDLIASVFRGAITEKPTPLTERELGIIEAALGAD